MHFGENQLSRSLIGLSPLSTGHRYLRMVIVTTAVYWGLNSQLRPKGLTGPLNLPAPGRSQSVYIVLQLRTDLCF